MARIFQTQAKSNGGPTAGSNAVTKFTSRGTRATQPLFSDLSRNFYITVNLNGNPFFSGNAPSGAQMKYDYNRVALKATDFFAPNLFGAYEYYRIAKIDTEFVWDASPTDGVVSGDLYTAHDFDSREAETSNEYINRRDLRHQVFTNHRPVLTDTYVPRMVDNVSTDVESKDYVQPQNRWWNCENVEDHRWGCLRYVVVAHDATKKYPTNDAAIFVRHKLYLEVKGLKNAITPSIPPAIRNSDELGNQL